MNLQRLGRIWAPNSDGGMFHKYGILPVPVFLPEENIVRVFFGSADKKLHSRIYSLDLDSRDLTKIVRNPEEPLVQIGAIGTFDDSGVVPSSAIEIDGKLYLYTVGFQRVQKVPYMLYAGLVISSDNGETFEKPHAAPILPRNAFRPISQGAPSVLFHDGIYKMWHWYSTKWIKVHGKLFLDYKIGYAESRDGLNWEMWDVTCLQPDENKGEFAVARPFVLFENGIFKMWYSVRHVTKMYRIGYAESKDGIHWERKDTEFNFDVSTEGWDSEMLCYPAIIDVHGTRYLFYNGNDNGGTGFGLAKFS